MGKFVIKKTKTGIKFDLKATNGQVIAVSEGYVKLASCMNGIDSVRKMLEKRMGVRPVISINIGKWYD